MGTGIVGILYVCVVGLGLGFAGAKRTPSTGSTTSRTSSRGWRRSRRPSTSSTLCFFHVSCLLPCRLSCFEVGVRELNRLCRSPSARYILWPNVFWTMLYHPQASSVLISDIGVYLKPSPSRPAIIVLGNVRYGLRNNRQPHSVDRGAGVWNQVRSLSALPI